MSYTKKDDSLEQRERRQITRRTQMNRVVFAVLLLTMSLSARAVVWSCTAKNGDRKFPVIEAHPVDGKGMFDAILAQLKITREEYKSLDVECVEAERVEAKGLPTPQPMTKSPRSGELRSEGLKYSDDLQSIYGGEFKHVGLARGSFEVASLVVGYRRAFSENCATSLPKNKVEITERKCEREAWRTYGNGMEVPGSRQCASYRAVGTGKYADPDVNEAADNLKAGQLSKAPGDLIAAFRNPGAYLSSKVDIEAGARKDMQQLLALNGCASSTTKRFQANLVRFGSGREAIGSSGRSPMTGDQAKAEMTPILARDGWLYALYWAKDFQGNNDPVVKMLRTPNHPDGPMVLKCEYETQGGQRYEYFFWPSAPPANIKALRAADSIGVLRYLGTNSTQKCPETKEKALELRRAAMTESGFPSD